MDGVGGMDTEKIAEFSIIATVSQEPDFDGNYGEIGFVHIPCGDGINTRSSKVIGEMALRWMMQHRCLIRHIT